MNKQQILDYLKANPDGVTIPELQERFSLKYGEIRDLFAELEKEGTVRHEGGFRYVYCREEAPPEPPKVSSFAQRAHRRAVELYQLRCSMEKESPEFKEIVLSCVLDREVNVENLKEKFHIGFFRMCEIINRMTELGLLDEEGNFTLTYREYFTIFDEDPLCDPDKPYVPVDRDEVSADDSPTEGVKSPDKPPFDPDTLWESGLVDADEDLLDHMIGNPPATAEEEDDAEDAELAPEEKALEQILVVFELLQESKEPPKDRRQALRDVELCISMFRKLPGALFGTLDRLEEARKNLADPKTTDYEDFLELLDSEEE